MDGDFKRSRRQYADMVAPHRGKPATAVPFRHQEQLLSKELPTSKGRRKELQKSFWLLALMTVLLVGVGVGVIRYATKDRTPIDKYAKQLDFSVYYPSQLPSGYKVSDVSITSSEGILFYHLKSSSHKPTIAITQQAMPPGFDASKMIGKDAPAVVTTQMGRLYNLSAGEQSKYMITTPETLIFFNTTSQIQNEVIDSLAASLRQVR